MRQLAPADASIRVHHTLVDQALAASHGLHHLRRATFIHQPAMGAPGRAVAQPLRPRQMGVQPCQLGGHRVAEGRAFALRDQHVVAAVARQGMQLPLTWQDAALVGITAKPPQ
jgi:hypothetical protein